MKNEHKTSSEGLFFCCRLKDPGSPVKKYCFLGASDEHRYSSCPPSLTLTLTLKGNISVNRVDERSFSKGCCCSDGLWWATFALCRVVSIWLLVCLGNEGPRDYILVVSWHTFMWFSEVILKDGGGRRGKSNLSKYAEMTGERAVSVPCLQK